jgi:hypothetical protein
VRNPTCPNSSGNLWAHKQGRLQGLLRDAERRAAALQVGMVADDGGAGVGGGGTAGAPEERSAGRRAAALQVGVILWVNKCAQSILDRHS